MCFSCSDAARSKYVRAMTSEYFAIENTGGKSADLSPERKT